ncbi:type III-B CRISPR module RAMP protein Cmr6 [Syntrophorhabdus aromaticivorans]|uniref:type III-B CRISPR module RAMP protein Cmr6 n=1 Tax=Syntrophorhabdus aromaticivorans TaxID=328301 RepID=UPI0004168A67|nr:type III-B CRISPR module RAMP protein Cmr6 [Syntrophorhabdus aromaticivorans]
MFLPLPESITRIDKTKANYSLLFNKWVNFDGNFAVPKELKENKVKEFIRLKDEYNERKNLLEAVSTNLYRRINCVLSYLQQTSYSSAILHCKVFDALICGIGDEHALENSIRLDHCTGLPCIPSSSIKGVAKFAAEFDKDNGRIIENNHADIFGTPSQVGNVQFWDGFPLGVPVLKIDIMNNHFQDYYSGTALAPSDDMNPNPVPFIVVDSGSEFYFPVVAPDQDKLDKAVKFLKTALEEWGVGAKTSVGYGMFCDFREEAVVPPPQKPKKLSARDKALENLKKTVSTENFRKLLLELKKGDEDWLRASNLFAIPNFNIGFAEMLFENSAIPLSIQKELSRGFIGKINLKEARKRAEKKNDRKDLDRYEKLKAIIDANS